MIPKTSDLPAYLNKYTGRQLRRDSTLHSWLLVGNDDDYNDDDGGGGDDDNDDGDIGESFSIMHEQCLNIIATC